MTRFLAVFLASVLSLPGFAAAAYLVKDFPGVTPRGSAVSVDPFWTTIGNTTWFWGYAGRSSFEIWKTDGSPAGTIHVVDIVAPEGRDQAAPLVYLGTLNDRIIFGGHDAGGEGVFAFDVAGGAPQLLARTDLRYLAKGGVLGGVLYFTGRQSTGSTKHDLWRTDGTPGGTYAIDYRPGTFGAFWNSREWRAFVAGGAVYFFGTTDLGNGLHRTDGTVANTTLLLPMSEFSLMNDIGTVVVFEQRVLFDLRAAGERPAGLWAADATSNAASLLAADLPHFTPLGALNGKLYFAVSGSTVWTTDGTAAGTNRQPLSSGGSIGTIAPGGVAGSRMYFYATSGAEKALFVTEGTAATTRKLMVVDQHAASGAGFAIGDRFYFAHDDGVHGSELWVTDGSAGGTQLVADVAPGADDGFTGGAGHPTAGGAMFVGSHPEVGAEPWITDGSAGGTRLLANIARELAVHSSSPENLAATGGRLFFSVTLNGGPAVGISDGSSTGTLATLLDVRQGPDAATASAGRYFYLIGSTLFATDGTTASRNVIHTHASSEPIAVRDGVVFLASDSDEPGIPWFSNGTASGTRAIELAGVTWPAFVRLVSSGDHAWIVVGSRVWRTDGSAQGTTELAPVPAQTGETKSIASSGGAVYLVEERAENAILWRYDGGTPRSVAELPQSPSRFITTSQYLFFTLGARLYRTDGTTEGTIALPMTMVGDASYRCPQYAVMGDALYALTLDEKGFRNLWRTDGTVAGTVRLLTMQTRSVNACEPLATLGSNVYFAGWDAAHGWEPWVTDGTIAGTSIVTDIYPGRTESAPADLTTAGDRVFFSATGPFTGRELWAIGPNPASRSRSVRH